MKEIQSNGKVSELLRDVSIPKMFHAKQTFPREMIRPEDIPAVVNREMGQEQFSSLIKPGMEIAITAEAAESEGRHQSPRQLLIS